MKNNKNLFTQILKNPKLFSVTFFVKLISTFFISVTIALVIGEQVLSSSGEPINNKNIQIQNAGIVNPLNCQLDGDYKFGNVRVMKLSKKSNGFGTFYYEWYSKDKPQEIEIFGAKDYDTNPNVFKLCLQDKFKNYMYLEFTNCINGFECDTEELSHYTKVSEITNGKPKDGDYECR